MSQVLLTCGSTMLRTRLGLRRELDGYRAARIGLVLAFHAVGLVRGSIYAERIFHRVGFTFTTLSARITFQAAPLFWRTGVRAVLTLLLHCGC
jgi:hypothetical protein